jgi:hypothetical protein
MSARSTTLFAAVFLRRLLLQDLHGAEAPRQRRSGRQLFEPIVRQAAGLGEAPTAPDPDRYVQFMIIATC